jgi:tRNA threonylcarbamoyladenosine biosynthesis protein TsaE
MTEESPAVVTDSQHYFLPNPEATEACGRAWATLVCPGLLVSLRGELGTGKTSFVRGLLHGLGFEGAVKSPTYPLLESYNLPHLTVYHFDFYRINHPDELEDAGFRELFNDTCVCLVEWPERAGSWCPPADLLIELHVEKQGRRICISAATLLGQQCLARLPRSFA